MDKLPATPSPYRFLLKSKNTPAPYPGARHQSRSQQSGHESSALENLDTPRPSAVFELASSGNSRRGVDSRTQHQTRGLGPQSASASPVNTEDTKLCSHNGLKTPNAGTEEGAGLVQVQEDATGSQMRRSTNTPEQGQIAKEAMLSSQREPTSGMSRVPAEQMRTPSMCQFKAAPKFRFGSSQNRSQSGSGVVRQRTNTETRSNVTPRPTQGRWMATRTPLRHSLRREPTEEEIVDLEENEMLMEDVRESIERQDIHEEDDEHGHKSYIELDFATPVAKRRKVSVDPVETFPSQNQRDDDFSCRHHDELYAGEDGGDDGEDRLNKVYGNDDEEMLDKGDHADHEGQLQLDREIRTTSQSIHPHPQPATPAPTYFQRPRFILPSSTRRHIPQHATPQTQHPPQETFAPTPHFILHTQIPVPTPDDEPQFTKPPKFRPIEEPEPSEPLPAEFSPRKRGQKFVIGGLANEVRSWLVDLETQHSASSTRGVKDADGWKVKMLVEEVSGGKGVGWTVARGKMDTGEGLSMILGGEGMMEGLEKCRKVDMGCVVGITAPIWEVEVRGDRWGVGANWKVCEGGA